MGTELICTLCNTGIQGDEKGTFIFCECGACYIDQTKYYTRIGGDPRNILIKENGEYVPMTSVNELEEKPNKNRIDIHNYYLEIAESVARKSTCLKRAYGAVIVNNKEIISTGYNGSPRGIKSCLDTGKCLRKNSYRGTDYSNCLSCHAEQNAIISASRRDMIGGTLYLTGIDISNEKESYIDNPSPCSLCKIMIINAGIESVIIRLNSKNYIEYKVSDWTEQDLIGGY
jgi:dCMP deaminase